MFISNTLACHNGNNTMIKTERGYCTTNSVAILGKNKVMRELTIIPLSWLVIVNYCLAADFFSIKRFKSIKVLLIDIIELELVVRVNFG